MGEQPGHTITSQTVIRLLDGVSRRDLRARCSCGWEGPWRRHEADMRWDATAHRRNAEADA